VGGGETCEAESLAALESFKIVIQPRGGKASTPGKPASATKAPGGGKQAAPKPAGGNVARPAAKPRAKA